MNKCVERLYNGIIKENPTFVLMLGMCPTLAVTTTAINGVGMGLSTTAVLVFSNLFNFRIAENYSGSGTYSGIYCNCCFSGLLLYSCFCRRIFQACMSHWVFLFR